VTVLEGVELATLLAPPARVSPKNSGLSPLWKGCIWLADGSAIKAYIKKIPCHELLAEVVCALIGKALDLPIPRPYLVRDEKNFTGNGGLPLFAMEDAEHPSLNQTLRQGRSKVVYDRLIAWDLVRNAAIFDEWIANVDRNEGNLLFDGEKFTLIDHGKAFDQAETLVGIDPTLCTTNLLGNCLIARHGCDEVASLLAVAAVDCAPNYSALDFSDLHDKVAGANYTARAEVDAADAFLTRRIRHLQALIRQRGLQHGYSPPPMHF
jgi:hypothetical protein